MLANQPSWEFTINPGDIYYMPRGYIHEPFTDDSSHSLHVTFGVEPTRWEEFLHLSLNHAARHAKDTNPYARCARM